MSNDTAEYNYAREHYNKYKYRQSSSGDVLVSYQDWLEEQYVLLSKEVLDLKSTIRVIDSPIVYSKKYLDCEVCKGSGRIPTPTPLVKKETTPQMTGCHTCAASGKKAVYVKDAPYALNNLVNSNQVIPNNQDSGTNGCLGKGSLLFSKRKKLADDFAAWVAKHSDDSKKPSTDPFNVITFLDSKGYFNNNVGGLDV